MSRLDLNRLALLLAVVAMLVVTALFGYRLDIGWRGLTFENYASPSEDAVH